MKPSPRPYLIEEYTTTVCPHCFEERQRASDEADVWKDGMLVSHDGSVWMRRFCARHGETESLYEADAELWRARKGWSTPTSPVVPDRAENFGAFPHAYRDGLPASHGQHTCILLLNVTKRCNYECPTCYASALAPGAPASMGELPTRDELLRTVQTVIAREGGQLSVLMLSGGEPTVRDDLPSIIEALLPLPITRIMLNTNGRRVARDDKFLAWLHDHRERIEVYLQFDGLRPASYQTLRGEDVSGEKIRALKRLDEAGIWTTLVMTVARGVNEDEAGDVLQLGLNTPHCAGAALQPVFGSGRNAGFDPLSRATPTGLLRRLGEQTNGLISASDFVPLPCSHPDCCDITYLLRTPQGWQSLPRLLGRDELRKWIHLVSNTIAFEDVSDALRAMLQSGAMSRVFSEQLPHGAPALARDLLNLCDCVPGLPLLMGDLWQRAQNLLPRQNQNRTLEQVAQNTFRVTIKMFMDAHTLHAPRLRQCCVHTGTFEADPRRYSFCWRWLFADATDHPDEVPQAVPRGNVIPLMAR